MGTDPCRWGPASGVYCDGGQTVSAIHIDCRRWGGELGGLLSPMLAEYSSVRSLVIRGCGLWSGIPASLYQRKEFTSLHTLDLSGNALDGPLPAQLEWGATRCAREGERRACPRAESIRLCGTGRRIG